MKNILKISISVALLSFGLNLSASEDYSKLDVKKINKAVKIKGVYSRKKLFGYTSLGNIIGLFFVRSVARSNNIYKAMKLKGY